MLARLEVDMRTFLAALALVACCNAPALAIYGGYNYINAYNMVIPTSELTGHGCEHLRTEYLKTGEFVFTFRCYKERNVKGDSYMYFDDTKGNHRACLIVVGSQVRALNGCYFAKRNDNTFDVFLNSYHPI